MKAVFMNKFINRTNVIWLAFLVAANALYLIYEFAFNARLTDAAAGSLEELSAGGILHALEMEGRTLSGIGLTLIGLRILLHFAAKTPTRVVGAAIICAVCFPTMFFGQKMVVDQMVNQTTAEQRQDAKLLLLLRQGLSSGTLQLADMPIAPKDMNTAATRSLLSIVGMMTFASDEFIAQIKDQGDVIISHIVDEEARKKLPDAYRFYKKFEAGAAQNWDFYQAAVLSLRNEENAMQARSETAWSDLQQELIATWQASQTGADEALAPARVEEVRSKLDLFMRRNSDCVGDPNIKCNARDMARYDKVIQDAFGKPIAPDFWCHEPRVVRDQVVRGGRLVAQQREVRDCSDMNYSHVLAKMGSLIGVVDFESFIKSAEVAQRARGRLFEQGLDLPEDWTPAQHDTFIAAHTAEGKIRIYDAYETKITEATGKYLSPDMSAQDFVEMDAIQMPFRQALGLANDAITPLNLSSDRFLSEVFSPIYVKYGQDQKAALWVDVNLHADGGALEAEGKSAVRALVVPGIAMSFSLVFVALNSIGMITSIARLTVPVCAARIIQASAFVLAIGVPFAMSTSTRSTSYQYLQTEFSSNFGGLSGAFATWVVNAEPMAYSVGRHIARIAPPLFSREAISSDTLTLNTPKE